MSNKTTIIQLVVWSPHVPVNKPDSADIFRIDVLIIISWPYVSNFDLLLAHGAVSFQFQPLRNAVFVEQMLALQLNAFHSLFKLLVTHWTDLFLGFGVFCVLKEWDGLDKGVWKPISLVRK